MQRDGELRNQIRELEKINKAQRVRLYRGADENLEHYVKEIAELKKENAKLVSQQREAAEFSDLVQITELKKEITRLKKAAEVTELSFSIMP